MKTFLQFFFQMRLFFKTLLLLVVMLSVVNQSFATHNRAGEIVYQHISGYKYKIIIYTYCYTQTEADRDELELDCGDGSDKMTLPRISKTYFDNEDVMSFSYLCKNVYEGEHTFSGPGTFILYMEDPNRNDGVNNIPNSVNVVFALKTTLIINPVTGDNSSPVLLNSPMDKAALNKTFVHNPGAYDPDGDSLSYKIGICLQQDAQEIVGYSLPPVTDSIYVNPVTGDFVWEKPAKTGVYNVAMIIEEWRNGMKIGQMLRDIQVEVIDTDNHSPEIKDNASHCVVADSLLSFEVSATDPDGDRLQMSASGGPFVMEDSPATFTVNSSWAKRPVGVFEWQTTRNHIRRLSYDVLIKVVDDDLKVPLTSYKQVQVKVIAPAPEITDLKPTNSTITVTWNKGGNENAVGYYLYRTNKPDYYKPGQCETGLPENTVYELIAQIKNPEDTVFTDSDNGHGLPNGFAYSYRVTAYFADGAESIVSKPRSAMLSRGIVAITKASVNYTDKEKGSVVLEWVKPENIDTISVPPPYFYEIFIAHDQEGGIDRGVFHNPVIIPNIDSVSMNDENINTEDGGTLYKMCFVNKDQSSGEYSGIGSASMASTVYLKLTATDRKIIVDHVCDVPWQNDTFVIYRKDPDKTTFDSIGYSLTGSYVDYNVVNGQRYGYKMKTIGYYSAPELPTHIENFSQEAYAMPLDTIPPCVSTNVKSFCTEAYNYITWKPDTACGLGIEKYFLYYSETLNGELRVLEEFTPEVTSYQHYPELGMAGCYAVAAQDSAGNKSKVQERVCVDQCDYYRLPNVFTPNGDGKNDLFHPYPYQFVDHIEMTITDRWGKEVFTTTDPDINWDATDKSSGQLLADGVYFYRCTVYEHRLTGLETRELTGYITIFSKKTKN